jgi:hypothetical protein
MNASRYSGAHASITGYRLLARDDRRYRTREGTSFAWADIGHQSFRRVVHVAVRDVVTGPRRIPALVSGPVQLSGRLDLACPEDHLMASDLGIE